MATNVLAQIPRRRKRRIQAQAERAASRIYDPEIQAYQAQRKGVRRQYRRDVRANRGVINYTNQALSRVPLKGLHGGARQAVAAEIALSRKDATASLPMLNAEARQARTAGLADIKSDIVGARVEQAQDAARRYATLLGKEATYQTQEAKDEATERADRRKRKRERQHALKEARRVTMNVLATEKPPWDEKVIRHYDGDPEAAWRAFEERVADEADVSHSEAAVAVRALRRRLLRDKRRGMALNPEEYRRRYSGPGDPRNLYADLVIGG
jgi:hypothetical protein